MTCREKLRLEHPECLSSIEFGGCYNCPKDYGYMDQPDWCRINDATCTRCWDREIPGTEIADCAELAHRLASLRDGLISNGFSHDEAITIICNYVRGIGGTK